MKKLLSYAACMLIVLSVAATPNSRLIKSFNETFPNAKNVKWNDDKSGYFVSFAQNENFEIVLYSKTGEFVCSWKYSGEKELPTNVMMVIKKKYEGSKVTGVTEFSTAQNVVYDVKLSKGSNWYSVKALPDGTLASEEKYSKD